MTTFIDPLAWLFGLEQFGIKFGLENITAIVEGLGHPERAFQSVHVAGTNGKGSVTAMIDAVLLAAGYRSARYTSPHLLDLSERFVIGGHPIDQAVLGAAVEEVRASIERLPGHQLTSQPTFFEVTTAVAFHLFRQMRVDVAVCEVGLGGRLDATNVLRPMVTAITSIGFDHQRYLGNTLREIAHEKAGIIKPQVPVVVGRVDDAVRQEIERIAGRLQAPVVHAWSGVKAERLPRAAKGSAGGDPQQTDAPPGGIDLNNRIELETPIRNYGALTMPLPGDHQIDNAVVAIRSLEMLAGLGINVPDASIASGFAAVRWPGRLDLRRLPDDRLALLDAAHNPDGAAALGAFLASKSMSKLPLVFAVMRDKDADGILRHLVRRISALVLTRASNRRSADPSELAQLARRLDPDLPILIEPAPPAALEAAWRLSSTIIVAGSIFLLGDVMRELDGS
jgi:dihydrofolate synthase/folylpolyglutamate synthase